ncbi:hypothetical protein [Synechococcus phage BUCT-ZZ01]|nr:hypothetical protein [Synechococcus phage BUCT-ZZ01]
MKIVDKVCYVRLMMMMEHRLFSRCVLSSKIGTPNFAHESMNGYIETDVEFDVSDVVCFAKMIDEIEKSISASNDYSVKYRKLVNNYFNKCR